jgi:UMF1 family MFS transporter
VFFVIDVAPAAAGGGLFATLPEQVFLVLGGVLGAVAGPLQAASRTLLVHLAPRERVTQYFGLFALSGKVTSFLAPLSVGLVTAATASQAAGMAVILAFFSLGLWLLLKVRDPRSAP